MQFLRKHFWVALKAGFRQNRIVILSKAWFQGQDGNEPKFMHDSVSKSLTGSAMRYFSKHVLCTAFLMATNVCAAKPDEVKTPYGVLKTEREKLVVPKEMCNLSTLAIHISLRGKFEFLSKLFPFHGCDRANAHRSLLDCCVSGEATVESVVADDICRARELSANITLFEVFGLLFWKSFRSIILLCRPRLTMNTSRNTICH